MLNKLEIFLDKARAYRQDQLNDDFTYKDRDISQWLAQIAYSTVKGIKKISLTSNKFILLFLGLWMVGVLAYIWVNIPATSTFRDFFVNNLTPELFGFGLEGILLTGILTMLLERKENRENKKVWLSFRMLLIPPIRHLYEQYDDKSSTFPFDVNNPESIFYILKKMNTDFSRADITQRKKTMIFFRNHSAGIADVIDIYIPLLAQTNLQCTKPLVKLKRTNAKICQADVQEKDFSDLVIDFLGSLLELDTILGNYRSKKNIQQLMNLDVIYRATES